MRHETSTHLTRLLKRRAPHLGVTRGALHVGVEPLVVPLRAWRATHAFLQADPDAKLDRLEDLYGVRARDPRGDDVLDVYSTLASSALPYRACLNTTIRGALGAIETLKLLYPGAPFWERALLEQHGVEVEGLGSTRRVFLAPDVDLPPGGAAFRRPTRLPEGT